MPELKTVTMYTSRPIRDGEQNGVEYFFVDRSYLEQCRKDGILIECRTYDTVYGPWSYFTADDGQIDLKTGNYLIMGTLESYGKMRAYYGEEALVPIYIYVEDGLRPVSYTHLDVYKRQLCDRRLQSPSGLLHHGP